MRRLFLFTFLFLLSSSILMGQEMLRGKVTDAETQQPVDGATVCVVQGTSGRLAGYALTDAAGEFVVSYKKVDSLSVSISCLGYQGQVKSVAGISSPVFIALVPETFCLREVEIRPGRIWGTQDTITYNLSQFASSRDVHIKDVLRRLPGIDIDPNGTVRYKGKAISKYYVEGLDLMDGRYSLINNNLHADAVEKVQVLENHQPIKALRKKVFTEEVALNLKLKPEVRSRWLPTAEAALGAGNEGVLWQATANVLQLSHKSQSAYLYKSNNTGNDLMDEQRLQASAASSSFPEPGIPAFLRQPPLSFPLAKHRGLFNHIHTLSVNRLYKTNDDFQIRINAYGNHDFIRQQQGSATTYYQANDTARIEENSRYHLRRTQAGLAVSVEGNTENSYLSDHFSLSGEWNDGMSAFSGTRTVTQRMHVPVWDIRNLFHRIRNQEEYSWEFNSLLRYHNSPAELSVAGETSSFQFRNFYTDNAATWLKKKGIFTWQATGGVKGETAVLRKPWDYRANHVAFYLRPSYMLETAKLRHAFSLRTEWLRLPAQHFSRLRLSPSASISYKLNYRWRFGLSGSLSHGVGDISRILPGGYLTDYRTRILNCGKVPESHLQEYALYGEYKNTVKELFFTLTLSHSRRHDNLMTEQQIQDGWVTFISHPLSSCSPGWSMNGTFSKGFYDFHLKTELDFLFSRTIGKQLSEGVPVPYRYDYMQYCPKVIWTPFRWLEAEYRTTVGYGGSRVGADIHLVPLLQVSQRLALSATARFVEAEISVEHYYNDIDRSTHRNTCFADASVVWRNGAWKFTGQVSNLLNKKNYRYSTYNAMESNTAWVELRPREFLVSVCYLFR